MRTNCLRHARVVFPLVLLAGLLTPRPCSSSEPDQPIDALVASLATADYHVWSAVTEKLYKRAARTGRCCRRW